MRWLLVLSLTGLAACSSGAGEPRAERDLPEPITISSPAFTAGSPIPVQFTCDGDNRSPPLRWSGVPASTVEAALVVDDPDAPRGHLRALDRRWPRPGQHQAGRGHGSTGRPTGPQQRRQGRLHRPVPSGRPSPPLPVHHLRPSAPPDVGDGASPQATIQAIEAAARARGRLVGTYGR